MLTVPSRQIIKTGFIVGTLDIIAACINFYIQTQKNPLIVLQYIASAVLGKSAYEGGWKPIALGLLFHYTIALSFTVFFFWVIKRLPIAVTRYKFLTAIIYGCFMWAVMRFIVLPFTKLTLKPINTADATINILILVVCIGLPLVYTAANAYKRKSY